MHTEPLRKYGDAPYRLAVVHGGPGATGSLAPLAKDLSAHCGVLEPLQRGLSINAQVAELADTLLAQATDPVILLGHSWGAWLALITAARHPQLVSKLILVGSGPFEESYATGMMDTRLGRLTPQQQKEARQCMEQLGQGGAEPEPGTLARFGELMHISDSFDPLPDMGAKVRVQMDIYQSIWPEAAALRRSGELLSMAEEIRCPLLAIHGDYDPHPAAGVQEPLQRRVKDFRFVLLPRCGHEPWAEAHARQEFFRVLGQEMR